MIFAFNPLSPKPNDWGHVTGKVQWELMEAPIAANLLFLTKQYSDTKIIETYYLNADTGDVYKLTHRQIYGEYDGTWFKVKRA